jgi:diacylglycerol kinase family enzyme
VRLQLIVNVSASAVTPRVRVVIAEALAASHDLEVVLTSARGHATELAAEAAADGRDAVVVLGGDGTLNEAANGLAGTATALAVMPGGSTNVFARTIGVRPDPVDATGQLLETLRVWDDRRDGYEAVRRRVGTGVVNGRRFLFHLGVGFDAAVIDRVERRGVLKRYAGHPVFVMAAVQTVVRGYDRRRPRFRVEAGEERLENGYFAVFLNSDPYTYLGHRPLHLAPGADLDSGLSVVAFTALGARSLLGVAGRALGSGRRVARHPDVWARPGLGAAEVWAHPQAGPVPYQVDGDYLGTADHLAVAHTPGVLDLMVPATPGAGAAPPGPPPGDPARGRPRLRPRRRRGR